MRLQNLASVQSRLKVFTCVIFLSRFGLVGLVSTNTTLNAVQKCCSSNYPVHIILRLSIYLKALNMLYQLEASAASKISRHPFLLFEGYKAVIFT